MNWDSLTEFEKKHTKEGNRVRTVSIILSDGDVLCRRCQAIIPKQ